MTEPTTYPIMCAGPGPHDPADGILGETDVPDFDNHGMLCLPCAALLAASQPDPTSQVVVMVDPAVMDGLSAQVNDLPDSPTRNVMLALLDAISPGM